MLVGGTQGGGADGTGYRLLNENPAAHIRNAAASATLRIARGTEGRMLELADTDDPASPFALRYRTGRWALGRGGPGGPGGPEFLHLYTRQATPANGYPRDLSGTNGAVGIPSGFFTASMRYRGEAAGPPTTGTWQRGDTLFNTAPVAGGWIGWQCVASGTPGTWKGFGAIQP